MKLNAEVIKIHKCPLVERTSPALGAQVSIWMLSSTALVYFSSRTVIPSDRQRFPLSLVLHSEQLN